MSRVPSVHETGTVKLFRSACLCAVFALLSACAAFAPLPPPPSPQEIVAMAGEGKTVQDIIQRIDAAQGVYRLSASELAKLREQGVPDAVIDHMQATYLEAIRREEAWRQQSLYPAPGWPYRSPFNRAHPYRWWR